MNNRSIAGAALAGVVLFGAGAAAGASAQPEPITVTVTKEVPGPTVYVKQTPQVCVVALNSIIDKFLAENSVLDTIVNGGGVDAVTDAQVQAVVDELADVEQNAQDIAACFELADPGA